jgi:hypothetical protein
VELLFVVGGMVALAVLAPPYGVDSRDPRDRGLFASRPAHPRRPRPVSAYEPAGVDRLRDRAWSPMLAEAA